MLSSYTCCKKDWSWQVSQSFFPPRGRVLRTVDAYAHHCRSGVDPCTCQAADLSTPDPWFPILGSLGKFWHKHLKTDQAHSYRSPASLQSTTTSAITKHQKIITSRSCFQGLRSLLDGLHYPLAVAMAPFSNTSRGQDGISLMVQDL